MTNERVDVPLKYSFTLMTIKGKGSLVKVKLGAKETVSHPRAHLLRKLAKSLLQTRRLMLTQKSRLRRSLQLT